MATRGGGGREEAFAASSQAAAGLRETPIQLRTVYEMPASSSACLAHTRSMASRKARVCLLGMEDRQTRPW